MVPAYTVLKKLGSYEVKHIMIGYKLLLYKEKQVV